MAMWSQSMIWVVGLGMARDRRFRISTPSEITVTSPRTARTFLRVERSISNYGQASVGATASFPLTRNTTRGTRTLRRSLKKFRAPPSFFPTAP
jgi:hypothetical protein